MRDRKRLFIAIDIPKEAKDFFRHFKDRLYDFPGRWSQIENLHITLAFLGSVREEDIPTLITEISKITHRHEPFYLTIEKIDFEIDFKRNEKLPRMIWAKVGDTKALSLLYRNVSAKLNELTLSTHVERPHFSAHITLCRLNTMSFKEWHSDELPDIAEEVGISFPVTEIHLMESKLRRGGPEYFVLQSFPLGAQ